MKKIKKKHKKPTEQEKEQRQQKQEIERLLVNIGFKKILGIAGKEFFYDNRRSEIDGVFCFENVVLVIEYTICQKPGDHLLKKKPLYDKINDNPTEFIRFLLNDSKFEEFKEYFNGTCLTKYTLNQLQVVILYCSKNPVSNEHKHLINKISFFDYPIVKYFESVARVIKRSTCYEFFKFLNIDYANFGDNMFEGTLGSKKTFSGHILPEERSSLKQGYKIVSFYIDAYSLLKRAYVLRRDGWKQNDTFDLYQRMFVIKKINDIRKYLYNSGSVFVNNIITVLPIDKIKLSDENNNQIKIDDKGNFFEEGPDKTKVKLTKVKLTKIEIEDETNIIGIIDGQHRIYAYHESNDKYESKIKELRKIQNLLVTGILYPKNESEMERLKFEASLFKEINSNQTKANSQLTQEIELITHPFSSIAIAKSILNKLNKSGPLENLFEQHFYEKGRLKTASIISYGLKPLVKLDGQDSLYKIWQEPQKDELRNEEDDELLEKYKEHCAKEIRNIFIAFKSNFSTEKWGTESSDPNCILRVTVINGIINCLRNLIENNDKRDLDYYKQKLKGIENYNFKNFKSSQYRKMGIDIYEKFFK